METASTGSLNEAAAPHEASNFSGRSGILEQDLAKRLSNRAVKPRGFSPGERRRVPCLGLGRGGNA